MTFYVPWEWDDTTHVIWRSHGDLPQASRVHPAEVREVSEMRPPLDGVALRDDRVRVVPMPEGGWAVLGREVP